MFLVAPWALAAIPSVISGIGSLFGGRQANVARSDESALNRRFQEKMRNTQWQSTIADMEAAGINPALAYSQGPNASPSGNIAQQSDAISPAISSAMQMRRMTGDLKLLKAQTRKAEGEADTSTAKGELEQYRTRWMKTIANRDPKDNEVFPIMQMLEAELGGKVAGVRRTKAQADILGPMAGLSERMGEWLPILMMLSAGGAGGILKGGTAKASKWLAGRKAIRVVNKARRSR